MTAFGFGSPTITAYLYRAYKPPFDMRPYLKALSLKKDLTQPAGAFDFTLAYAPDEPVAELLDDMLPNDYVEFHVQTKPGDKGYRMRGFIDNATPDRSAGTGAQFQRDINVTGRDYGALLQDFQIAYTQSGKDQQRVITGDGLATSLGYKDGVTKDMGVRILVRDITNNILNQKHIKNLRVYNKAIKYIAHTPRIPGHFGYAAPNFQAYSGTLNDLIAQVQSPPWGEYFVRDNEDGPELYFRIAPFLTHDGYYAWDCEAQGDVAFVHLPHQDVIDDSLTKSKNEVWTYFLTMPTGLGGEDLGSSILGKGLSTDQAVGNPYYDGAAGSVERIRARRFGFRPMQVQSPWVLGDPKQKTFTPALQNSADPFGVATMMNLWLVHTLGHAEDLRSGTIVSHGVHGARVGDYVYYDDPLLYGYYYVQGVDVEWAEGSALTETLTVIRGQANNHMDTHVRNHPKRAQKQRHARTNPTRLPGRRQGP
jgi:hypothetical protein